MHTDAITLHSDDELATRREGAAGQPVIIARNGVRYRTEREDPFAFSDPEKMRAAIRAGAGAFKGIDGDQFRAEISEARGHGPEADAEHRALFRRIVREAKPAKQPTEYGPESRYGRDSHRNGRYNDAPDAYEDALLTRIGAET